MAPDGISADSGVTGPSARPSPTRQRLAVAVAVCTFVLIFVGGSVTSNDAGLAIPDWPSVEGQNMFLYPPSQWVGDKFFEHVHRLAGAAVGLLTIALALWTQWREPRRWVRVLVWVMLAAVIVQGVMGGLRVTERSVLLAIVHGCFAQLFFSSTLCLVAITSRGWSADARGRSGTSSALRVFSVFSAAAVFGQLILGAIYRHLGRGFIFHVMGAVVISVVISVLVLWISGHYADQPLLTRLVKLVGGLFIFQLVLGVSAYVSTMTYDPARPATIWEWLLPSLHVAIGASILAVSVSLSVCVYRFGDGGRGRVAVSVSSGVTPA